MRAPVLRATIERRLLVNYRVDLDVLASILPRPFRPVPVHGVGLAGICLIRLADVRPSMVPTGLGVSSESAAHRVAVEWDTADGVAEGVYIPRRDTSSKLVALLGAGRSRAGTTWPTSTSRKGRSGTASPSPAGTARSRSTSRPGVPGPSWTDRSSHPSTKPRRSSAMPRWGLPPRRSRGSSTASSSGRAAGTCGRCLSRTPAAATSTIPTGSRAGAPVSTAPSSWRAWTRRGSRKRPSSPEGVPGR